MKKIFILLIVIITIYGCKKGATPQPVAEKPLFLIGAWQRLAMSDTVYTGTHVDSIHHEKVVTARVLIFHLNGIGIVKEPLTNFSYSGYDPYTNIVIESSLVESWRIVKVSDTKIRLIRHMNNIGANNIGYQEEYTKQ